MLLFFVVLSDNWSKYERVILMQFVPSLSEEEIGACIHY